MSENNEERIPNEDINDPRVRGMEDEVDIRRNIENSQEPLREHEGENS